MKTETISIDIPQYQDTEGFRFKWEDKFSIKVNYIDNEVIITANEQGLRSLANHLLNLSQETIPAGYHIHFDDMNSLEYGSAQLTIEKK